VSRAVEAEGGAMLAAAAVRLFSPGCQIAQKRLEPLLRNLPYRPLSSIERCAVLTAK
jgi:hypothetical protein